MSTQRWRYAAGFARIAVTFGAAYLVYIGVDWNTLSDLPKRADFSHLVVAVVILAVQFAVMVWRWRIIIEMLGGATVGAAPLAIALGRSMLIGLPLPSTVGTDMARVLMLSAQIGAGFAARSVICDRVVALGVLIALVIAIVPFFGLLVNSGAAFVALAAVSLGGIATLYLALRDADWLTGPAFVGQYPALVLSDCRRIFGLGRRSWGVLLLSLATHLLGVGLIHQLAHVLASPISLLQCLMIVPPSLLISAVPISLGGWGIREGALAAGFALVGASSETGVATSVLFGLTGLLIGLAAEMAAPIVRRRDGFSTDGI